MSAKRVSGMPLHNINFSLVTVRVTRVHQLDVTDSLMAQSKQTPHHSNIARRDCATHKRCCIQSLQYAEIQALLCIYCYNILTMYYRLNLF